MSKGNQAAASRSLSPSAPHLWDRLGMTVADRWNQAGYDPRRFSAIARAALEEWELSNTVQYLDIVEMFMDATSAPYQQNISSPFGQPPLTLFWHPRFFIEGLFWLTETTTVHDHGFVGAFTVLEGTSVQSRYTFETTKVVDAGMQIGRLEREHSELLTAGAVAEIGLQDNLIHSVMHVDVPSVTVVIRTHSAPVRPGCQYLWPGMMLGPFPEDQLTARRYQCLTLLSRLGAPQQMTHALRMLDEGDLRTAYRVLDCCRAGPGAQGTFPRLASFVIDRYAEYGGSIVKVCEELDRLDTFMRLRRHLTGRGHRIFLALVMSQRTWPSVVSVLREMCADDPIGQCVAGVREIMSVEIPHVPFDAVTIDLVKQIVSGDSAPVTLPAASAPDIEAIAQRARAITGLPLLRPLCASNSPMKG
jgi:hypothetical protein